jgi:hypothetical protein
MPIVSDTQQYQLIRADGTVILKGSFSQLMEVIPQSTARLDAEAAILAAKVAKAREDKLQARADSLRAREDAVTARERQADAAALRGFVDSVSALAARMDAFEEKRHQEALDALPDPDFPGKNDYLPQSPIEPSAEEDRKQEAELEGAEEAIEKDDALELKHAEPADQDLGVPAASLSPIMGKPILGNELPSNTAFPVKSDGFICARDRKAHRKLMRTNNGARR